MSQIVLVDLSSIAHPIWHTSQSESDPNMTSQRIVARVNTLAASHPHVAICIDRGRSFRKDLAPSYKANRPEHEAALMHQIDLAIEQLGQDGFPLWAAPGFEADDLIATATMQGRAQGHDVLIVTGDKDLLQLVGEHVKVKSAKDGSDFDAAAVQTKLGVRPDQVRDYLCLCGDASDNVKGAKGIGPKKAAELLARFESIDNLYREMREVGIATLRLTPGLVTALKEFDTYRAETAALITLRTDAPLPFDDLFRERVPSTVAGFTPDEDDMTTETETAPQSTTELHNPPQTTPAVATPVTALAPREPDVLAPAPAEWEKQLEPRSMREVKLLATDIHNSRLFLTAYGTPQAVMSTLLAGRELGLQAMASLRAIHIIEGKPTLSADLIRALILRSGLAKYFRCAERSATQATFETQRGDDPPMALTFTIAEAKQAWSKSDDAWGKSGWAKNPADMLVARAGAKLARLVYPDVLHGIYETNEIEDSREAVA